MNHALMIFLGAGVGGLLRYWLGSAVHALANSGATHHFPFGTLFVNVTGCVAIGFLVEAFAGPWKVAPQIQLALLVGVLGGYTTFSSFGRETIELFHANRPLAAMIYVLVSNAISLTATWIGFVVARKMLV